MPTRSPGPALPRRCKVCDDEVEALVTVKVDGKSRKVCEDCAERLQEQAAIAEESESVVQGMMGFKGRRPS